MTKQTIEVEGFPEGWKAVAFRMASNENVIDCGEVIFVKGTTKFPCLVVEKIQPRKRDLKETVEGTHDVAFYDDAGCWTYWNYVKETNIPLTNGEPKLSLSVIELKALFTGNWELIKKIKEFIKENSHE